MVDAPKRRFVAPVLKLPKKPAPLGESDLWAGRARAVGQGLFSFGDEAEAAVRAGMGEDYTTALNDIRAKYRRYKDEEPGISTGIELGTGIASAFIPGVGLVGRGAQALGRLPGVANEGCRPYGRAPLPLRRPRCSCVDRHRRGGAFSCRQTGLQRGARRREPDGRPPRSSRWRTGRGLRRSIRLRRR